MRSTTPTATATTPDRSRRRPELGELVGVNPCPACRAPVPQVHRAGRHRIYCDNACRQRAYRWRRAQGIRLCVARDGAVDMLFNSRLHARRHDRDPAARLRDQRSRNLTACGVFAKRLRSRTRTYHQFVPESPSSCDSCIAVIGVGPFGSGIPPEARPYWPPWQLEPPASFATRRQDGDRR